MEFELQKSPTATMLLATKIIPPGYVWTYGDLPSTAGTTRQGGVYLAQSAHPTYHITHGGIPTMARKSILPIFKTHRPSVIVGQMARLNVPFLSSDLALSTHVKFCVPALVQGP